MSFWLIAFHTLSYLLAAIGLGGALLLFVHSVHAGPNRRILCTQAFIFLMWGFPAFSSCIPLKVSLWHMLEPMGVLSLLNGNLYIALCLLYPLELAQSLNTGVRAIELRNRFPYPSAPERHGLRRLHYYGIGMICITLVYLGVLLNGNLPSMVLHRMTTTLFFGILLFVTLFRPHSVPQSLPEA